MGDERLEQLLQGYAAGTLSEEDRIEAEILLTEYVDGETSEELAGEIEAIVRDQPELKDEIAGLRRTLEAVQELPDVKAPPSILAGVRAAIAELDEPSRGSDAAPDDSPDPGEEEQQEDKIVRTPFWGLLSKGMAVAAALLLAVQLVFQISYMNERRETSSVSMETDTTTSPPETQTRETTDGTDKRSDDDNDLGDGERNWGETKSTEKPAGDERAGEADGVPEEKLEKRRKNRLRGGDGGEGGGASGTAPEASGDPETPPSTDDKRNQDDRTLLAVSVGTEDPKGLAGDVQRLLSDRRGGRQEEPAGTVAGVPEGEIGSERDEDAKGGGAFGSTAQQEKQGAKQPARSLQIQERDGGYEISGEVTYDQMVALLGRLDDEEGLVVMDQTRAGFFRGRTEELRRPGQPERENEESAEALDEAVEAESEERGRLAARAKKKEEARKQVDDLLGLLSELESKDRAASRLPLQLRLAGGDSIAGRLLRVGDDEIILLVDNRRVRVDRSRVTGVQPGERFRIRVLIKKKKR